jgi:hypothetical protein
MKIRKLKNMYNRWIDMGIIGKKLHKDSDELAAFYRKHNLIYVYGNGEVAKYMPGNADARKVGKAISRVVDGGMGGMEKEKTPEKTSRTIHGTVEYFLPMRRFTSNWVGKVERR